MDKSSETRITRSKSPEKRRSNGSPTKPPTPSSKENTNGTKTKRKKHKRKPSDPAVKDITQIMSNFIIISPSNGALKQTSPEIIMESDPETTTDSTTAPKVNAFDFMMSARLKVIGSNSPGKELTDKSPPIESKSPIRAARKKMLEDWSDAKGATKRKREYEEAGNWIADKLEKRAKKLKEMLNVNETESDDEIIKGKRKVCRILESDSETSRTSFTDGEQTTPIQNGRKPRKSKLSLKKSKNGGLAKNDEATPEIVNSEVNGVAPRVLRDRKSKPKSFEMFLDDEMETPKSPKSTKKPAKVAPVFTKSAARPKIDPQVAEARRQFLLSSIPSAIKKEVVRECSVPDDKNFEIFPLISHVTQQQQNEIQLPQIQLNFLPDVAINFEEIVAKSLWNNHIANEISSVEFLQCEPITKFKKIIVDLKNQHPNYPIFRTFNFVRSKNPMRIVEKQVKIPIKRGRGRPKKVNPLQSATVERVIIEKENVHVMWTEKYKPSVSSDIIGNCKSVTHLKNWLVKWTNFGVKQSSEIRKLGTKCDSGSEFESTDCDSRDSSVKMFSNGLILSGPCSSGKSSAVYAVCNELGFNVLEVNASSRRSGKWLFQELQEATQSHQVRKTDSIKFNGTFLKQEKASIAPTSLKMCVLLIEDIDIIFEQDDGFLNALSQIMSMSKRPLILTTSDATSPLIQKFLNQYDVINFVRPSSQLLSIWLQILCLVDGGILIDKTALEQLLEINQGDIRKTLLQLQFWVHSGGQINDKQNKINTAIMDGGEQEDQHHEWKKSEEDTFGNEVFGEEDDSNLSDLKLDENEQEVVVGGGGGLGKDAKGGDGVIVHKDCFKSFENMEKYETFTLPRSLNLEKIWWNLTNLFSLKDDEKMEEVDGKNAAKQQRERRRLQCLADFYSDLSLLDVVDKELGAHRKLQLKDSLELEHTMTDTYKDCEFINDLGHFVLAKRIEMGRIGGRREEDSVEFNSALPSSNEQRFVSKRKFCDDILKEAISKGCALDGRAVTMDYLPNLRNIARAENKRADNNTKRGNRFHNCLKSFGVHCSDATYKMFSEIFKTSE